MLGRSHALSGAAAGAATGVYVLHTPLAGTMALAVWTAGFVTLNDLDSCGSSAARALGPLTGIIAHIIRRISGGHRHATHSIPGIAIFTGIAWLACRYRIDPAGKAFLALFLALGIAAGLRALRLNHHGADVAGVVAAAAAAWTGWGLTLIPAACGVGVTTHILGDMLTNHGCPLVWPWSERDFRLLPEPLAFSTGTRPETLAVVPLLLASICWLAWQAGTLALTTGRLA